MTILTNLLHETRGTPRCQPNLGQTPQPEIAAMLVQTYPGHPRIHIFTGAVGDQKGSLGLFRVKPEMSDAVEMPYLIDAPAYRAPSGFASTDRGHVERHVKMMRDRESGQPVLFDDSIELLQVPAETIQSLLAMHPALTPVDVLQVPLSAGDCNTGLVGCLLMVRELEGVDAGSTSVVGGA